ncbi:MAG: 3-isopropylmalate dehydratase large subunit [Candidatus Lokiarchaeota archaeon]|nr:3-isopropylmalate dehydratase large subunit [Candidatus Lokiarchaeota archaeon]
MTQKILSTHIVKDDSTSPVIPEIGEIIEVEIDVIMVHEQLGGRIAPEYEKLGLDYIKHPERVVFILDHWVPSPTIDASNMHIRANEFAKKYKIENILGENKGICHTVLPEQGFIAPGMIAIGSDSHTTTYGAFNCFSTGVGATDICNAFATGTLWFKVPEPLHLIIKKSTFEKGVFAKDLALSLLEEYGVDDLIYQAMEFSGPGLRNLTISSRVTLANMSVEMGAKNAIFEFDSITENWLLQNSYYLSRHGEHFNSISCDEIVEGKSKTIDLSTIQPMIAKPYSPDNVSEVNDCIGIEIDQGFIGSCTNGSLEDLRSAAYILKGHTVHPDTRCVVIPASAEIYLEAMREGLIEIFMKAGCIVGPSTCGPCFGGHMGVLGDNEVCISTTNRNFRGRMGSYSAQVYLASPATVAASVIQGKITSPSTYME